MGQVLGFAHCKESPSTASTTPDSTDGGNDESDFPELQTAREFSEDEEEEEASVEWGTPRELTFSYITIAAPNSGGGGGGGGGGGPPSGDPAPRNRRDSQGRRARAPLPRTETCETFVPALGDSLENIPSLCPSPEAGGPELDPFAGWEAHSGQAGAGEEEEGEERLASQPHSPAVRAAESGQCSSRSSDSSSETSLGDLPPLDTSDLEPEEGGPNIAGSVHLRILTSTLEHDHCPSLDDKEEEEGEAGLSWEPTTEQRPAEADQSESPLEICILGCLTMFQKHSLLTTSQPLRMPAIDVGQTSGENASGTWPHSPGNTQQPSDSGHESLRQDLTTSEDACHRCRRNVRR